MILKEARQYINKIELFKKPVITRLGKGNNTNVFLIKDGKNKFTMRANRKDTITKSYLENHYITLKFLEQEKIDFAPLPTHYDKKENILITSYVPGRVITDKGLTKKQLDLFISQLVKLYSLKYSRFKYLCKKMKRRVVQPETPMIAIKKYGWDRFRKIQQNCDEPEMINWVKAELTKATKRIKDISWTKNNLIFVHGDLTGANIVTHKDKIFFIDWETARYVYSLNYSLAYMLIHFDFFNLIEDEILKKFARRKGLKLNNLREAVLEGKRSIKLNDIIWALKMYSELKKQKTRGWKKYLILTKKRIKEYNLLKTIHDK